MFIALTIWNTTHSWPMVTLLCGGLANCALAWLIYRKWRSFSASPPQPAAESQARARDVALEGYHERLRERQQANRVAAQSARGKYGRRAFGSADPVPRDDEACAIARDPALNEVDVCCPREWPSGFPEAVARMDAAMAGVGPDFGADGDAARRRFLIQNGGAADLRAWTRGENTAQQEASPPAGGSGGSLEAGAADDGGCDE